MACQGEGPCDRGQQLISRMLSYVRYSDLHKPPPPLTFKHCLPIRGVNPKLTYNASSRLHITLSTDCQPNGPISNSYRGTHLAIIIQHNRHPSPNIDSPSRVRISSHLYRQSIEHELLHSHISTNQSQTPNHEIHSWNVTCVVLSGIRGPSVRTEIMASRSPPRLSTSFRLVI